MRIANFIEEMKYKLPIFHNEQTYVILRGGILLDERGNPFSLPYCYATSDEWIEFDKISELNRKINDIKEYANGLVKQKNGFVEYIGQDILRFINR